MFSYYADSLKNHMEFAKKIILFGFLFVKKIEKTNVEIKSKTKAMKSIVNSINRL